MPALFQVKTVSRCFESLTSAQFGRPYAGHSCLKSLQLFDFRPEPSRCKEPDRLQRRFGSRAKLWLSMHWHPVLRTTEVSETLRQDRRFGGTQPCIHCPAYSHVYGWVRKSTEKYHLIWVNIKGANPDLPLKSLSCSSLSSRSRWAAAELPGGIAVSISAGLCRSSRMFQVWLSDVRV